MALSQLILICRNLNIMYKNLVNIFQGIYGLTRILILPIWNVFKVLIWSMNCVDYYWMRINVLSDEYVLLKMISLLVSGFYKLLVWIFTTFRRFLFLNPMLDSDDDDVLPQREGQRATRQTLPKIRSDRIDDLVNSRRRDTAHYRSGYPGLIDNPNKHYNVRFYRNELSSTPDGDFVDNIHRLWWGNHKKLEYHHGYIQWLFPVRESGMNYQAKELEAHEAKTISSDSACRKRIVLSYKMMLDFYGVQLVDEESGAVERADNWKERFAHLNKSFHNFLRVTRILKCLGELGFEKYKSKLVEFLLKEIITENTLPNCFDSCISFWVMVVKDDVERARLLNVAKTLCDQRNGIVVTEEAGDSEKITAGVDEEKTSGTNGTLTKTDEDTLPDSMDTGKDP